jgi:hypothetical protein
LNAQVDDRHVDDRHVDDRQVDHRTETALDAARAFGVMLGGSVVLVGAAAAGALSVGRSLTGRRRPSTLALAGVVGTLAYATVIRPWHQAWGATRAERMRQLPGDELVEDPAIQTTRAVTIDAPVNEVWRWLAQIGQDRGGFYSYEWVENLAGCEMHNADRVHDEWQQRDIGETVLLHPATGLQVARFEPDHALAFDGGWYFVVEPVDERRTRLFARGRIPKGLFSVAYAALLEIPHFIMERKMLLGIKDRAERSRAGSTRPTGGTE